MLLEVRLEHGAVGLTRPPGRYKLFRRLSISCGRFLLACAVLSRSVVAAAAAGISVDDFWRDYPPAAQRLSDFYSHVVAEAELSKEGGPVQRERYFAAGGRVRWEGMVGAAAVNYEGPSLQSVVVANPDRSFSLKKEPSLEKFAISAIDSYGENIQYARLVAVPIFASYCAYESTVKEWLSAPKVKIKAIDEVVHEGKRAARVSWSDGPTFDGLVFDASFTLLPDDCWALVEFDLARHEAADPAKAATMRGVIKYASKKIDGVPIVQHVSYWSEILPARHRSNRREWNVESVEHKDVPAGEFTLAAFGLAEPAAPLQLRNRWLTITAVAAALILFALFIRRIGEAKSPRSANH